MLLIYLAIPKDGHPAGTIVGENPDDAMAETLASQYGSDYGIACLPHAENRAWLEKTVQAKIKERVWVRPLAQSATPQPGFAEARDGSGATVYIRPEHQVIGGVSPGPDYELRQEEAFQSRLKRAGQLSVEPATGSVLMDGRPAPIVQTAAAVDAETTAAIRRQYSPSKEMQMLRQGVSDKNDPEFNAYRMAIEAAVTAGREKKQRL